MSNFCAECGKPLPISSEVDLCSQHGGPGLKPDDQIRCPFCRETILADARKCRFCGEFLVKETSVSPPPRVAVMPQFPRGSMYCTSCGNVGLPRGMDKLELFAIIVISIFTLFIPLMIYLVVRSGKRCRKCRKKALIPLTSPVARGALESVPNQLQGASRVPEIPTMTPRLRDSAVTQPASTANFVGNWMGRHLVLTILIVLFVLGSIASGMVDSNRAKDAAQPSANAVADPVSQKPSSPPPILSPEQLEFARRQYAMEFDRRLIEAGIESSTLLAGPHGTTLQVTYALTGRVVANEFQKRIDYDKLKELGFKNVVLTNGFHGNLNQGFQWPIP